MSLGLAGAALALSRVEGYHFAATALGGLTGLGAVFALLNIYLTGLDPLSGSFSFEPPFYRETGKGTLPKIVKFQVRPDPLAH